MNDCVDTRAATHQWALARSRHDLDPARHLGQPPELPPASALEAGDWCDVVISDGEGEMRWTLVVESVASITPPLDDAPGVGRNAERVAEREGPG